jgi:pyrroloquinoline quinone biosynthesis protein E
MGGWGSVYIVVAPDGRVLPCQAAWQIESLAFDSVRDHSLEWIWRQSSAFNAFRGDEWMQEPCRSCPRRGVDFGGCRCQAFQVTGDARNADPVCTKSPARGSIDAVLPDRVPETSPETPVYVYRTMPATPRAAPTAIAT